MDVIPILDTVAVLVLAAITTWYAVSTARMLKAMVRQAEVQVLSAQVSANAALLQSTFEESGARAALRELLASLRELEGKDG